MRYLSTVLCCRCVSFSNSCFGCLQTLVPLIIRIATQLCDGDVTSFVPDENCVSRAFAAGGTRSIKAAALASRTCLATIWSLDQLFNFIVGSFQVNLAYCNRSVQLSSRCPACADVIAEAW